MTLFQNAAGPFALSGLILLGIAILWARQIVYSNQPAHHHDSLRLILSISGNLLIVIGVLGAATHVLFVFAPVIVVVVLGVIVMLVMRFRSFERRSLLNCISLAAEKGIPLNDAVRAFANERSDEIGYRAAVLADALDAGMNLPDAMEYARTRLPTDALLAMRFGYETGQLEKAVSRIAKTDENLDSLGRSIFEKYFYLGVMVLVTTICITFFALKIAPVYERIFQEFGIDLPSITLMNLEFSRFWENYFWVMAPPSFLLAAILVVAGFEYIGFLPRDFPGMNWASRRTDSALVMRALSIAVGMQWPINKTVWLLARIYPKRGMRGRLVVAGRHIDNGADWCDSLYFARLIGRSDCAVLKSAQRVGNTEWALEEMADSSVRRLAYWARLFLNTAFPLALLFFGLMIGFFAVGFLSPMVTLVQELL